MVYYIRFLKPPVVSDLNKTSNLVTSLITITTDLGDASLWSRVDLIARLVDVDGAGKVVETTKCSWQGGKRTVSVVFTYGKDQPQHHLRVQVTTEDTARCCASFKLPEILDVWSAPFRPNDIGRSASLVERRLRLCGGETLRIWEETGNSIACHIWDAAVGCLQCFQPTVFRPDDSDVSGMSRLHALLRDKRARPLRVIELGAGCGIAGIALAQLVPHCSVFLTDLPEAQELLQKNIDVAKPAPGSSLRRGLLEWGPVSSSSILQSGPDLVLISDCTYNADSCAALVQTLVCLAQHAKDIKILVAMKRRHDAEAVFEHKMDQNGFTPLECTKLAIPHRESEMDPSRPVVELYLYEWLDAAGNTSPCEPCGVPKPSPRSSCQP